MSQSNTSTKTRINVRLTSALLLAVIVSFLSTGLQASALGSPVTLYRLYNPQANGQHFLTTDLNERNVLATPVPQPNGRSFFWTSEPTGMNVYSTVSGNCPDTTVPVYRIYNAADDDHLLTLDYNEVSYWTINHHTSWSNEGIAFCVFSSSVPGSIPIYRVLRSDGAEHFLTSDQSEANNLVAGKWGTAEGIAFYTN
jgi:hypothetical protein